MKLSRTSYDSAEFAILLVPRFKQWARIDHDDDDGLIVGVLAACIATLERTWGIAIVPATYAWEPYTLTGVNTSGNRLACYGRDPWGYVPIPVRGAPVFKVMRGATNITAQFMLSGDLIYSDFGQQYLEGLNGATIRAGDVVTLNTPDDPDATKIPPDVWNAVARYTLYVWENRESGTDKAMSEVPDWLNHVWGPLWSPRV